MKKQGLLISGCNDTRFQNDLGLAYSILHDILNFDNIDVFYYRGRKLHYNDYNISTNIASRDDLIEKLKQYCDKLNNDDIFFMAVTNHGAIDPYNSEIFINLYDDEYIYLQELSILLSKLECKKIIIMGQCYGGNMMEFNCPNTVIISASEKNKPSYPMPIQLKKDYDEFFYYFFSYLNKKYSEKNIISDVYNHLTIVQIFIDAYKYAKDNTKRSIPMIKNTIKLD